MDNRKINMDMDELFRKKLESSELIPGGMVRENLMKRLGRREFVRFNPARFNIYYLGGIVAAAVATAIFISVRLDSRQVNNNNSPVEEIAATASPAQNTIITEIPVTGIDEAKQSQIQAESRKKEVATINSRQSENKDVTSEEITSSDEKILSTDTLAKATGIKDQPALETAREVSIQKRPYASFITSVTSGCIPLKVKFFNKSTSYDSCVWSFGDGGLLRSRDSEWIFDKAGEYKVTLKVFGADGTESVSTETITVHPRPVAQFKTSPEKPIIPDDAIRFTNYSKDAVKYRWNFGDGRTSDVFEPEHRYSRYSSYNVSLIAWSPFGCSDTLLVKNAFAVSGCYIDFPNAFIPNQDGPAGGYYSTKSDEAAQIFHPVTSGVSDYQLRIFSKTGVIIFESNDINIGWDGYNKGKLCEPGVYVWKVRGTFRNGEPFVKMGDVTIIRN